MFLLLVSKRPFGGIMTQSLTVQADTYGPFERMLNRGAAVALGCGLACTDTRVDSVLAAVAAREGNAWGNDRFIEVYRALMAAIDKKPVTPLARVLLRAVFAKAVGNRVRMEEFVGRNPRVHDVPVRKPIFIVGFPRTGTTVLQNLLALHPTRRAPQYWELANPVPASDRPLIDRHLRLFRTKAMLQAAYRFAPEQSDIHQITATSPEEDWALMALTFSVYNYDLQGGLPEFGDYLLANDMSWAYRELRRMFQVLLLQRPAETLVTKCPEHLWFLDALLEAFPDACIVWTHRDPFATIASYCSLTSLTRRTFYGDARPHEIGPYIADRFHLGVTRAMEVRRRLGDDRFIDIPFEETVANPIRAVRRICYKFGLPYGGSGTDTAIRRWLEQERADKRGAHRYDAARYGLDRDKVDMLFADYNCRFKVALRE